MRMIVIKQASDVQGLTLRLFKRGSSRVEVSLDKLKKLNPHVDFSSIDAGTVLLVPDHPDFDDGDATSVGGEAFDSLAKDATTGLKSAIARIRGGFERQDTQRKEVGAVFRSAAFKRLAEGDEALKTQAGEAESRFKAETKRAAETAALLEATEKAMQTELAALAELFK